MPLFYHVFSLTAQNYYCIITIITGGKMQVSSTYNRKKNDHINRASMARICGAQLGIKEVSPLLYRIAAPVSELARRNKNGEKVHRRHEIEDAIPWDERSMKTFGVVYSYESTASFIGLDGKTYVVPNDRPVLDHLKECGYAIAPYGSNVDGTTGGEDSLVVRDDLYMVTLDRRLPPEIVQQIDEMEKDRPYYLYYQPYASLIRFGGTLGIPTASVEELQELSLSERKIANISRYNRIHQPQKIEDYVKFALRQHYLDEKNFTEESGVTV